MTKLKANILELLQFLRQRLKKLTIVDIVLLCFFIGIIAFILVFLSRSDERISITVKVTDPTAWNIQRAPSNEFAAAFIIGDKEKSEFGQVQSEIISVNSYQPEPDQRVIYLEMEVKANYSPLKDQYSMKGRTITFGQPFVFNFNNVKFEGLIVDFPSFKNEKIEKKWLVTAQIRSESRGFSDIYGIPDYVAATIKAGDAVYDSLGNTIIKVIDVSTVPAKRSIVDNGVVRIIEDPSLVDVYLTLELHGYEIGIERYIYDFYPIKIGSAIPITTGEYSIWPTILTFE